MRNSALLLVLTLGVAAGVLLVSIGGDGRSNAAQTEVEEQEQVAKEEADLVQPVARPQVAPEDAPRLEDVAAATRQATPGPDEEAAPEEETAELRTYAVYGQVVDERGNPLPGVSVTLHSSWLDVELAPNAVFGNWGATSIELSNSITVGGEGGPYLQGSGIDVERELHIEDANEAPDATPTIGKGLEVLRISSVQPDLQDGGGPASPIWNGRFTTEGRLHSNSIFYPSAQHAVTDENGEFDFGEVLDSGNGRIEFAGELFVGKAPNQPILFDDRPQLLRLPPRPLSGLALDLVTEGEGGPIPEPEWASFDLQSLAEDVPRGRREPDPWDVTLSTGAIEVRGLAPGTWKAWIQVRGGQPTAHVFTVEGQQGLTRVEVTLASPGEEGVPQGRLSGALELDATNTRVSRDSFAGFDDYAVKGQSHRGFGGSQSDAFFAHTISGFGNGPVRAAYLEVVLEAVNGMCHNDSIGLEYRGADASPRWAWAQNIPSLPGFAKWRVGNRKRLVLDLSRLPTKDGPVNLLGELEDGLLDVFVQDDTAVHSIKLRPYR